MKCIIRWTNKYSGEQGYVGNISTKRQCFHTADRVNAKQYQNEKSAAKAITMLTKYGEAEQNTFEILAAE